MTREKAGREELQETGEERDNEGQEWGEGERGRAVAQVLVALAEVDDVVIGSLLVAFVAFAAVVAAVTVDADLVVGVDVHPHLAAERLFTILHFTGLDEGVLQGRGVGLELV